MAALRDADYRVRQVVPGATLKSVGSDRYEVDFSSRDSLAELHEVLKGKENRAVGMIINLSGLCEQHSQPGIGDADEVSDVCLSLFNVLKEFQDDLNTSAEAGGGVVVNVVGIDGQFGLSGETEVALSAAGTVGLCKSFRQESPQLSVMNIDVHPRLRREMLVSRLCDELLQENPPAEIGLSESGRFQLALRPESSDVSLTSLPIDSDSVVLVTGGGYGITASVTQSLAVAGPQLVIVGRSPLVEEPEATRGMDMPALRAHFMAEAKSRGERLVPAEIERAVGRIMRQRQLRENLDQYARLGAKVSYEACDVRNESDFRDLIDRVYKQYGRLDGVIHGAGIIQDKLIRDKTPESFSQVFRTKVDSAQTLAKVLKPEELKFLVFFSSVSARFGNAGQTDYSAANEYLNKLAQHLDRQWPARVVAINWGPWDSGMVSDGLRRLYASRGVSLIPIPEGVRQFERELRMNGHGSPEVVISCSVGAIARISSESKTT